MTDPVVHIIDDDESLRSAVQNLFNSVGIASRTYESVQVFLDAPRKETAGCLLLDVRMPGMSGIHFQAQLERLGIELPVIFITGHADIPMTVQAMKAGAVDFLTKPFREQDLLDAVSQAIATDAERRERLRSVRALGERFDTLTPREREIMALVTNGKLNKQVAGLLNLSEITIKIKRSALMKKMGARTLADLVKMAEALRQARSGEPLQ